MTLPFLTPRPAPRATAPRRRKYLVRLLVALILALPGLLSGMPASAASIAITSYNWAGFAARGPAADAIVTEFTVPAVTCTGGDQAMSIWAGFGGLREQSLVQAGVQVRCIGGAPYYTMFKQMTTGSGASTVGPEVAPGDYVRVVICPAAKGAAAGVCASGAPGSTDFQTTVAVKRGGTGDYQVWSESLIPSAWVNTRTETECVVERPRDAGTEALLDLPQFTPPTLRCLPYRSISPISRVNIGQGGDGYRAYRISIVPDPRSATADSPRRPAAGPAGPVEPARAAGPVTATGDAAPLGGARLHSPRPHTDHRTGGRFLQPVP